MIIRYNGRPCVVVKTGQQLTDDQPGSDLLDHVGVWFGEVEDGKPVIYTIPAEYVENMEVKDVIYKH